MLSFFVLPVWFVKCEIDLIENINKIAMLKSKFRKASNCSKGFIDSDELSYADKTYQSITFQKCGSLDFWQMVSNVIIKSKSCIPPQCNGLEVLHSSKENFIC